MLLDALFSRGMLGNFLQLFGVNDRKGKLHANSPDMAPEWILKMHALTRNARRNWVRILGTWRSRWHGAAAAVEHKLKYILRQHIALDPTVFNGIDQRI